MCILSWTEDTAQRAITRIFSKQYLVDRNYFYFRLSDLQQSHVWSHFRCQNSNDAVFDVCGKTARFCWNTIVTMSSILNLTRLNIMRLRSRSLKKRKNVLVEQDRLYSLCSDMDYPGIQRERAAIGDVHWPWFTCVYAAVCMLMYKSRML